MDIVPHAQDPVVQLFQGFFRYEWTLVARFHGHTLPGYTDVSGLTGQPGPFEKPDHPGTNPLPPARTRMGFIREKLNSDSQNLVNEAAPKVLTCAVGWDSCLRHKKKHAPKLALRLKTHSPAYDKLQKSNTLININDCIFSIRWLRFPVAEFSPSFKSIRVSVRKGSNFCLDHESIIIPAHANHLHQNGKSSLGSDGAARSHAGVLCPIPGCLLEILQGF